MPGDHMNTKKNDSSIDRFVSAIEENLSAWIPVFGTVGQIFENNPVGVRRTITGYPISMFNSVMDTHLAPEKINTAIQCIKSDAKEHKLPVLWWVVPSTQPPDLGKRLQEYDFSIEDDDPGMAVELENLNEMLPKPENFLIRAAKANKAWKQWSIILYSTYGIPSPGEMKIEGWRRMLQEATPKMVQAYTGFLDNKPVATSLILLSANAAGIYCVGTIPEARRKGIGAWMTLYPLLQARSLGYKIGVLFASEMGLGVYRSLGFHEYCKITSYCWPPE